MKLNINQQKALAKLAQDYQLKFIILFGSIAKNRQTKKRQTKKSDFDIAILAHKKPSLKEYLELIVQFSQILNIPSQKIDLSFLNQADPLFLFEATFNSQLLFGNSTKFDEFRIICLKKYLDHYKFFKLRDEFLKKKLYA